MKPRIAARRVTVQGQLKKVWTPEMALSAVRLRASEQFWRADREQLIEAIEIK
jgi:hypothetical protein